MGIQIPKYVEVQLDYPYLERPVVYKFPRLRKRDAQLDEQERALGGGRKMTSAVRLAGLLENAEGWEDHGLAPRGDGESAPAWSQRVALFFASEEMQEFAEDALLYRVAAVFPASTFRRTQDSGLAVDIRGAEGGQRPAVLPHVPQAGTGPEERVPTVPFDEGPRDAEAERTP